MKLKFRKKTSAKTVARLTKKIRIRKTVKGTESRPRLCVFRSGKHMYAQIVNDDAAKTLMAVSTLKATEKMSGKQKAEWVGKEIAKQAMAQKITSVVFDRNGFIYHGRIKAVADGARAGGLNF